VVLLHGFLIDIPPLRVKAGLLHRPK
jgi:hypothetical protein